MKFLLVSVLFFLSFSPVRSEIQSEWVALPLQHTGITTKNSRIYGDDSDHILNPLSYVDKGDGTILDTVTTLTWEQAESGNVDWESAADYCSRLQTGGYTDWRLPTIHELYGTVNLAKPVFMTPPFAATVPTAKCYWSGNAGRFSEYRWVVYDMGAAVDLPIDKSDDFHAKCVRYSYPLTYYTSFPSHFTVLKNGSTALDNTNGLMWQLKEPSVTMNWVDAISYCEGLTFGDFSDWRLPNIKELFSTSDPAFFDPAIDTTVFTQVESKSMLAYWSSSTDQLEYNNAWMVEYRTGEVTTDSKKIPVNVRCVRSGWPSEYHENA